VSPFLPCALVIEGSIVPEISWRSQLQLFSGLLRPALHPPVGVRGNVHVLA
jgi:hypothetical protein